MKIKQILFTILILIAVVGCKKIDIPDEEAKAIFGKWQFNFDSGGFSGAGGSNLFDESNWIEFTEKGFYRVYEGEKTQEKARFTVSENDEGSFKYKVLITKGQGNYLYIVNGESLLLSEDASDGFSYSFTRK
jgi:hypothetical protein